MCQTELDLPATITATADLHARWSCMTTGCGRLNTSHLCIGCSGCLLCRHLTLTDSQDTGWSAHGAAENLSTPCTQQQLTIIEPKCGEDATLIEVAVIQLNSLWSECGNLEGCCSRHCHNRHIPFGANHQQCVIEWIEFEEGCLFIRQRDPCILLT